MIDEFELRKLDYYLNEQNDDNRKTYSWKDETIQCIKAFCDGDAQRTVDEKLKKLQELYGESKYNGTLKRTLMHIHYLKNSRSDSEDKDKAIKNAEWEWDNYIFKLRTLSSISEEKSVN